VRQSRVRHFVVLAAVVLGATPAYAHGIETVFVCFAEMWAVMAAFLLFIPWGRLRPRITSVVVLTAVTVAAAYEAFRWPSQINGSKWFSTAFLVLCVVAPPVAGVTSAVVLAKWNRRGPAG
jgi:hypothetical protein